MSKAFGETTCLAVPDSFDEEGFLKVEIEGFSAWISEEEVADLRDHLTAILESKQ